MTVVAKCLIEPIQAPNTETAEYTAPVNTRAIIDKFTACNTSGAAVTLTVHLVTAAGTAGAGNAVISAQSIAAGTTYLCPEVVGHILAPGDFISLLASAATAVTVRVSGREVS